jgi:hypothetical protein
VALGTVAAAAVPGAHLPPVSVADAVRMTRIQGGSEGGSNPVATFSPDGERFVSVVWKGSLRKDLLTYRILRFEKMNGGRWSGPATVLSLEYNPGIREDETDQHATPIKDIQFLDDNVTIAFIGTFSGHARQVYTINTDTGALAQITHSRADVTAFGMTSRGRLAYVAALAPIDRADRARRDKWVRDGVSVLQHPGWAPGAFGLGLQQMLRFTYPSFPWYSRPPASRWTAYLANGRAVPLSIARLPEPFLLLSQAAHLAPSGKSVAAMVMGVDESRTPLHFETVVTLIDVRTGQRLASYTLPQFFSDLVWSPNSAGFIAGPFQTGSPLDMSAPATYRYIDVRTGRTTSFTVPDGMWQVVGWNGNDRVVLVHTRSKAWPTDFTKLGYVLLRGAGWGTFHGLGSASRFDLNQRYIPSVTGNDIVGVRDGLSTAPEIAVYNLKTRQTAVLTDLNPALRHRAFGRVSRIYWRGPGGSVGHFGYLIRPVGYVRGKRYPLIILLKDEGYDATDNSYIIDGQDQLGAFAAQMLANDGFVVLLTPGPLMPAKDVETPRELLNDKAHIESAIAYLDHLGLINPNRVGISGWSRSAMLTDYMIAHSSIRFAAASDVDGGGNYRAFMLDDHLAATADLLPDNDVDLHLRDVHTPLMSEEHGVSSLIGQAQLIGDLQALHKPVELYYYAHAPHNLRAPLQRYYSLTRNVDWFRFWLQGYVDHSPVKAQQYRRWQSLCDEQRAENPGKPVYCVGTTRSAVL